MGQARAGTLMLDPFAGTGSIMLAAAHFGAATWGGEIHPPMLRGKRKGLNVRSASPRLFLHPRLLPGIGIRSVCGVRSAWP